MIFDRHAREFMHERIECTDAEENSRHCRDICIPEDRCPDRHVKNPIFICPNTQCPCPGENCDCRRKNQKRNRTFLEIFFQCLLYALFIGLIVTAIYFAWQDGWHKGFFAGLDQRTVEQTPFVAEETPEGGPCRRWSEGYCAEAEDTKSAIQWSRYYLRRGDAESALNRWNSARNFYRHSINLGSGVGAQSAIYAAKRIQYQTMTCEFNDASLARISRDFDKNPLGALIEMKQKQQALKALAYYSGNVDNKHGAGTRRAIREFQADLWFDQTGVLTAKQTVLLICAGAQIAKDIGSQNVLGIMYAGGLGVRQNTDYALNWMEMAAQRGDADAAWNLALMYGTKTVLSSVHVCDAVQNAERADSYLREAAQSGHPAARRAYHKYAGAEPSKRWSKLSGDLNKPESMDRVGRGCNPNN